MRLIKRAMLFLSLIFAIIIIMPFRSEAASLKLKDKSVTLEVGQTYKISFKNIPKKSKLKCTYTAANKYVSVSKKGVVKAKNYPGKTGKVRIKAVVTKKGKRTIYFKSFNVKIISEKEDNDAADEKGNDTVDVESVSLNRATLSLKIGESANLTANVYPTNASDKTITWQSDDTSIASVSSTGNVSAIGVGHATITATSKNGKSADCIVTVISTTPTPSPNPNPDTNAYGLNQEWVVPGQWKFKITGIEKHYECNQYSDDHGEVLIISYFVENLGYQDEYGSGLYLFFDRGYDSTGYAAKEYPCTHTLYNGTLDPGTRADYSDAWVCKNSGHSIKLIVEKYASNGTGKQSATFVIPY